MGFAACAGAYATHRISSAVQIIWCNELQQGAYALRPPWWVPHVVGGSIPCCMHTTPTAPAGHVQNWRARSPSAIHPSIHGCVMPNSAVPAPPTTVRSCVASYACCETVQTPYPNPILRHVSATQTMRGSASMYEPYALLRIMLRKDGNLYLTSLSAGVGALQERDGGQQGSSLPRLEVRLHAHAVHILDYHCCETV